jgi:thiol-disulfide isomerase/thioredoxin
MDEYEDEIDEDILLDYKKQRMAQIQEHSQKNSFGEVRDFSATEWKEEVSNCRGIWVLIHLYAPGNPKCDAIDQILGELSKKYRDVKFLRIRASNAIKNFPESNCPTVLAYKDGELQTQFQKFGSEPNVKTVDWAFAQKNIWKTDLKSDPNKKEDKLKQGWKKRNDDDDDDY